MAPNSGSHTFRKLKIALHQSVKPVSTFASIKREDGEPQNGSNENIPLNTPLDDTPVGRDLFLDDFLQSNLSSPLHPIHEQPDIHEDGEQSGKRVSVSDYRSNQKSITFDTQVTLDSGHRVSLDDPLPKPTPFTLENARGGGGSQNGGGYYKQEGQKEIEIGSSELNSNWEGQNRYEPRRLSYRAGEMHYPLLQSTNEGITTSSDAGELERVASLTSSATAASPFMDEVRTPVEPIGDYLLSPVAASLSEFSQQRSWEPMTIHARSVSQRSLRSPRSRRSDRSDRSSMGDGARKSRRTSATNSASPASHFLSNFGGGGAAPPSQPDDEGQEIGENSGYIIGRQIGFGGFSVVKQVATLEGGKNVVRAVKIVRKQLKDLDDAKNEKLQLDFEREVNIWRYLKHRYILPLIAVYDTPFATFCITELIPTGTLWDLVAKQRKLKPKGLPTHLARRYIYQLGSALRYLHEDVRVVHRDVKLENCLLDMRSSDSTTDSEGTVQLSDFGFSDFITNEHRQSPEPDEKSNAHGNIGPSAHSSIQGPSLQYCAPELLNAPGPVYSPAADIWAYGVCMYAMLTGDLPFTHELDLRVLSLISAGEFNRDKLAASPAVQEAGDVVLELVQGCLTHHVDDRFSIADVLANEWFVGCKEAYGDLDDAWP